MKTHPFEKSHHSDEFITSTLLGRAVRDCSELYNHRYTVCSIRVFSTCQIFHQFDFTLNLIILCSKSDMFALLFLLCIRRFILHFSILTIFICLFFKRCTFFSSPPFSTHQIETYERTIYCETEKNNQMCSQSFWAHWIVDFMLTVNIQTFLAQHAENGTGIIQF